ncbi:hypothetical protein [Thermanaeromonas sp. C210]|uniref:hypothetical protein n=1 Tax=Thermanaeromonas sp. C210 TaxID=2731925 RepID=UPI00155C6B88|nr:hypothetical protein [Thermanaeromonas sp. C210]GFN22839.1 hypothetical protein TAMC210_11560 [Thermanaeromonas sp. C210]
MAFFPEEKWGEKDIEGLVVLGLSAWASITLLLMLVRSWTAGNWNWVAILSGLICCSASLGTSAWRRLVLNGEGERGEEGAS